MDATLCLALIDPMWPITVETRDSSTNFSHLNDSSNRGQEFHSTDKLLLFEISPVTIHLLRDYCINIRYCTGLITNHWHMSINKRAEKSGWRFATIISLMDTGRTPSKTAGLFLISSRVAASIAIFFRDYTWKFLPLPDQREYPYAPCHRGFLRDNQAPLKMADLGQCRYRKLFQLPLLPDCEC